MGSVWAECLDDKGEPFKSFTDFVEAPLPEGLRSTIEKLERYCFENQEVVPMIRAEIPPRQKLGTNQHTLGSDGIRPSDRNAGTGRVVTIARLKADPKHADLAARVVSGELSANAAATVPVAVTGFVNAARPHFTEDNQQRIVLMRPAKENGRVLPRPSARSIGPCAVLCLAGRTVPHVERRWGYSHWTRGTGWWARAPWGAGR